MKLLVDMNLSPQWVAFLRDAGWESAHWSRVGRPDATDQEILTYAAANDCVVLTHDLDFGAILAVTHGRKPSVVQIRSENISTEAIGDRIVAALRLAEAEFQNGTLLTVEPDRTRLRLLPLRPHP